MYNEKGNNYKYEEWRIIMTNIVTIDGNNIYDYFISGASRLIHSEKETQ